MGLCIGLPVCFISMWYSIYGKIKWLWERVWDFSALGGPKIDHFRNPVVFMIPSTGSGSGVVSYPDHHALRQKGGLATEEVGHASCFIIASCDFKIDRLVLILEFQSSYQSHDTA